MKKTATKHTQKFNVYDFFSRNVGFLGIVVVILFLVVYMLMQKVMVLENKMIELKASTPAPVMEVKPETSSPAKK